MKITLPPSFRILYLILLILSTFFFYPTQQSFAQGVWTQKADFGGAARYMATGFSIGNKGYIGIGKNTTAFKDFWEWDGDVASPTYNTWTQKADFGGPARSGAAGFSIGNKGYIGTGNEGGFLTNDFWEWDQSGNAWTQKADFGGTARYLAVGFSMGSKGYIGTGSTGIHELWEWDQANDGWTQKASLSGSIGAACVGFSIGTKGYIGTGDPIPGSSKEFWEWDQTGNAWTQKTDFGGSARIDAAGFSISGKGYIGTGYADAMGVSQYEDFWEWDQANDAWTQKANYGGGVCAGAVGFSIGNKGYIGTGINGSGFKNAFWEYDPNAVTSINDNTIGISVLVYPNPLCTHALFTLTNEVKDASLIVYNLSGDKVKNIPFSGKQVIVEKGDLSNGTYFYQVISKEPGVSYKPGKLLIQ